MGQEFISHSVGNDSSNFYRDVVKIQNLLNAHNHSIFPLPMLKVDGRISRQMIDNISAFQRNVVQMRIPDGRVSPGSETFLALQRTPVAPLAGQAGMQAPIAGAGVGSQVFIHGKTLFNIGGTKMYVSGTPQAGMRVPRGGTTSVLFIFKKDNPNKLYRLDYDILKSGPKAGSKGWEHNQKGVARILNMTVTNHQPGGRGAAIAGNTIKVLKHGGKALVFIGVLNAGVELYQAQDKVRVLVKHSSGFAGAWLGAKVGASGGASIAAIGGQLGPQVAVPEEIVTVPIAATVGAIGGGIVGFWAGEKISTTVYDRIYVPVAHEEEEWVVLDQPPAGSE